MQLLNVIMAASKESREVSMPERKDFAIAKDQRDPRKIGVLQINQ